MDDRSTRADAIDLLQELGLKEYESRSLVALSRVPQATAKEISEISDVPRTRVYDAIHVLEEKGLVEIQHTNPKQFRAVSIDEVVTTLNAAFDERTESLRHSLEGLEPARLEEETDVTHEVWALSGQPAIESRTHQLLEEAADEIVVVLGGSDAFTDGLKAGLQEALDRGVTVSVGAFDEDVAATVDASLPGIVVFLSGIGWLQPPPESEDATAIGRLLLVDRSTILVSSSVAAPGRAEDEKHAVFGRGFDNGLVAIVRRLMVSRLGEETDRPG